MSWPQCPECGADTRVVDTRPTYRRDGGLEGVRRRYACRGPVQHRWNTLELERGLPEPIAQIDRRWVLAEKKLPDQGELVLGVWKVAHDRSDEYRYSTVKLTATGWADGDTDERYLAPDYWTALPPPPAGL